MALADDRKKQRPVAECTQCGAISKNLSDIKERCSHQVDGRRCRGVFRSKQGSLDWKEFGANVKDDDSYSILRADSIAHIVLNKKSNTTGYVIFEGNEYLKSGILKKVSDPSLIIPTDRA